MSQTQTPPNPAQTYEAYFVPAMFRPWANELISRAQPRPGERVLDVACGTGIVARLIARLLNGQAQITGLDLSPAMIEVARDCSVQEGVTIGWHVGTADALPFPGGSFDLVLVQHGLQFVPDRPTAVREMHRVLAPGGRAATATWAGLEHNPFNQAFSEAVLKRLGTPALHAPFSLGNPDELRRLFEAAGFTGIRIDVVQRAVRFPAPDRFLELGIASASAAVPALQSMDAEARAALTEAIRDDLAEPLRQYTEGEELVVPMEALLLVAHKPR
jgi:ubiquinone/menaquinone biosynthesis C-methylase UbiE